MAAPATFQYQRYGQRPKGAPQPEYEVGTRKGFRRFRWELKDSNRTFWLMGHAPVKILMMVCLITGLQLFDTVATHPILTLLLSMEVSILTFFIFLNTFAVHRYMPFIYWPAADLFNDLFSCVFLVGGMYFAVKARKTMPMNYFIAVVLMGVAAFLLLLIFVFKEGTSRARSSERSITLVQKYNSRDENLTEAAVELVVEPDEPERQEAEKYDLKDKKKDKRKRAQDSSGWKWWRALQQTLPLSPLSAV